MLLERQGLKEGFEAPLDKLLDEGIYANPEAQAEYDDDILSLCRKAALNPWDKVREPGERLEAYTKNRTGTYRTVPGLLTRVNKRSRITGNRSRHKTINYIYNSL